MVDPKRFSPELIGVIAAELVGVPLPPEDLGPVATVLAGMANEMSAMRSMEVGETEPALVYEAEGP